MRAPGHLERPLPTALAALRIEIEFPVIPQVGTRIRPHIPILVFGRLMGLLDITDAQRHVLQDQSWGGKHPGVVIIPEIGHDGHRSGLAVDETELQGLITHQERHGTYPYRVYALGVIIEGHFQHLLRLDSVTVTALGKL